MTTKISKSMLETPFDNLDTTFKSDSPDRKNKVVSSLDEKTQEVKKEFDQSVIAEGLDGLAKVLNKGIKFQVHEESERTYVEIIDRETGEVIKQIPPEEMLKIAASLQEFLGLIVDEKA